MTAVAVSPITDHARSDRWKTRGRVPVRTHGGDVVDRVQRGEHLTVTRSGRRVAELVPVRRPALTATALLDRWRGLPAVDPGDLRRDVDAVVDASL